MKTKTNQKGNQERNLKGQQSYLLVTYTSTKQAKNVGWEEVFTSLDTDSALDIFLTGVTTGGPPGLLNGK